MSTDEPSFIRLLHLEDNPADAELVLGQLQQKWPSCEVVHASNRAEFVEALRLNPVDVIISDFSLGDFDGLSALILARELRPEIPFIFLSGTIGEERAVEALKRGCSDYVLKDRPARLLTAIQRALREADLRRSQHAAEVAIREAADRFNQLAEVSGDIFVFADLQPLKITYVSPSFERTWGMKSEKIYEEPAAWLESVHPEDRRRIELSYLEWIAGKQPGFNEEYRVVSPGRAICWVYHTGAFGRDAAGQNHRMSWVARDITTAKEIAEQSLRAQRLESIGLLAGGIAHDMNNALAPVLMGAELLRKSVPPESRRMLAQMEASAKRAAAMVRQLLGFARGAEGQRIRVEPWRALQEIEQLVTATFPKSITLVTNCPEHMDKIEIDPTQLYQVLVNLCVNARDAMPNGGNLTLGVKSCHIDESYAGFMPNVKPGNYVSYEVTDTGMGIPAELQQKIFDPFFTTKPAGSGTGLGLTTVASIAHKHGGFVRMSSEVGKGTCFKVFFPAVSISDTPFVAKADPPAFRGNGELVLLVDDEESVRLLLTGVLESFNLQVIAAADGAGALALFASHRDQIKLVLTDVRMPFVDGGALVRALRHMSADLLIISMSGLPDENLRRDFTAQGVLGFLQKPFSIDQLAESVRTALAPDISAAISPLAD